MHVYLCYSHKDKEDAFSIKSQLDNCIGINVFMDCIDPEGVIGDGVKAAELLKGQMNRCCVLIVVAGKNLGHSRWPMWEIGYADGRDKVIWILDLGYPLDSLGGFLQLYPRKSIEEILTALGG